MKACANVARHYSAQTTQRTMDWAALIGAVGTVYGPRALIVMQQRRAQETRQQRPIGPIFTVHPGDAG